MNEPWKIYEATIALRTERRDKLKRGLDAQQRRLDDAIEAYKKWQEESNGDEPLD